MAAELNDLSCALNDAQSVIENLKRKRDAVEAAVLEEKETLKAELDEERRRRISDGEAIRRSLEPILGEISLELGHNVARMLQAEMAQQADRDRQNYNRELQHLAIAKGEVEGELVALREEHNRLKIAYETTQTNLEEEKEKTLCRICLDAPKDAICLPCVHADYCFGCLQKHRQRSRTCPTCRTSLSGVLRSDICLAGSAQDLFTAD